MKTGLAILIMISLSACSKRAPMESASPPAAAASASVEGTAAATMPPPPPPGNPAATAGEFVSEPGDRHAVAEAQGVDLADLDYALHAFVGAFKRYPKDVDEMVKLKALSGMPKVPAGKRLVINQQTKTVELIPR
jgi:hypothetical protein